jgi:fibronectin type 3 domain-containing protein
VTAITEMGESAYSNEISVSPSSVPDAPINLHVEETNSVIISWEAGFDGGLPIIEYNIYRKSTQNSTLGLISTTSELSFTDANLIEGVTYEYYVCAVNLNGESPLSNKVSFTIQMETSVEVSSSSTTSNNSGAGVNNNEPNAIFIVVAGLTVTFGLGTLYARRRR